MNEALFYAALAAAVPVAWFFIYVSVRLGSAAYFRSKWEHFRRVINATNGEDNGEK